MHLQWFLATPFIVGMCVKTPYPIVSVGLNNIAKRKTSSTETIISQNVRGLISDERIEELFNAIHIRNLFPVYIQEIW